MAGKGPKPVRGFNFKKYNESDYWDYVEKKKQKKKELENGKGKSEKEL